MTDDERALEAGKVVLELRDKQMKLNELKSKATRIVNDIQPIIDALSNPPGERHSIGINNWPNRTEVEGLIHEMRLLVEEINSLRERKRQWEGFLSD